MDTSRALVILASAGPLPSNQTCLLFSANCTLGDDVGNVSSELFMHVIVCGWQSSELGTLDDADNGGWADENDLSMEAESALREKRRIEREQRIVEHRLKKQEKEVNRASVMGKGRISAVKMSWYIGLMDLLYLVYFSLTTVACQSAATAFACVIWRQSQHVIASSHCVQPGLEVEEIGADLILCIKYIFCKYITKKVAMCFPGGQGSVNMPYRCISFHFESVL